MKSNQNTFRINIYSSKKERLKFENYVKFWSVLQNSNSSVRNTQVHTLKLFALKQ
jgi:hypothetical protein